MWTTIHFAWWWARCRVSPNKTALRRGTTFESDNERAGIPYNCDGTPPDRFEKRSGQDSSLVFVSAFRRGQMRGAPNEPNPVPRRKVTTDRNFAEYSVSEGESSA
ncbi:hypothetical protein JCM19992_34050 [Thermostilla marina]